MPEIQGRINTIRRKEFGPTIFRLVRGLMLISRSPKPNCNIVRCRFEIHGINATGPFMACYIFQKLNTVTLQLQQEAFQSPQQPMPTSIRSGRVKAAALELRQFTQQQTGIPARISNAEPPIPQTTLASVAAAGMLVASGSFHANVRITIYSLFI